MQIKKFEVILFRLQTQDKTISIYSDDYQNSENYSENSSPKKV